MCVSVCVRACVLSSISYILSPIELAISWVKPLYFVSESDRLALVSLNASNQFTLNFTVSGQPEEVDNGEDHIVLNGTRYSLARRTGVCVCVCVHVCMHVLVQVTEMQ